MEAIQQIGAYAGLAAIIGLAVLSALYFSQARDVRRLRESASRSPERPAPARPVQAESGAATAREAAAPVASAGGAPGAAVAGSNQASSPPSVTALRPGGTPPTPAEVGVAPPTRPAEGGPVGPAPAKGAAPGDAPPRPTAPPRPSAPARRAGTVRTPQPRPGEAAARVNGRPPERSSLPYIALAVVGLLIVLGAGAFALGLVGGRSEPAPGGTASRVQRPDSGGRSLAPRQVTFSVLNGTSVDGLGKQVADELEAAGYRRGNVTNAGEQRATSLVMYAQGAQADARAVARRINVDRTEPADSGSQTLAGDATVIVLVGADRTR